MFVKKGLALRWHQLRNQLPPTITARPVERRIKPTSPAGTQMPINDDGPYCAMPRLPTCRV